MDKELKKIIDAIKENKCVLILGPEICEINSEIFKGVKPKDFDESLRLAYDYYINHELEEGREKNKVKGNPIQFNEYSFVKENLLTYPLELRSENHLYEFSEWFFSQMVNWKEPFSQIAQLPFSLILSLLPDEHLEKIMYETNKDAVLVSSYSRFNEPPKEPIDRVPIVRKTVLYKLLGNLSTRDSVFTFEHWFDFIFKIIRGEPELPEGVLSLLRSAKMIVFVGVRVEKWYIQMLIRLLLKSGRMDANKFAFVNVKEERVEDLAEERFDITYNAKRTPVTLLNDLYSVYFSDGKSLELKSFKTAVFISYNHSDKEIAYKLKNDLEGSGIHVIIDTDNPIGFDIPKFINESVAKADFIIQLISKNFLTSAWVAQESNKAFTLAETIGKIVMPCEIDASLEDTITFRRQAMDIFNAQLKVLKDEMLKRLEKDESTKDLEPQRDRLLQLKNTYDSNIAEFQKKKRGNLQGESYKSGFQEIIDSIKKYQSKAQA